MSEQYFVALIYCEVYVLIILYIYFFVFCIFSPGFLIKSIFNWIYVADILKDFYTVFMKIILYSIAFYVFVVFFPSVEHFTHEPMVWRLGDHSPRHRR